MNYRENIKLWLDSLVIFGGIKADPVLSALYDFCCSDKADELIRCHSRLAAAIYEKTDSLTDYIEELVLEHEQVCAVRIGAGEEIPRVMEDCLIRELGLLSNIAGLSAADLWGATYAPVSLAQWKSRSIDLKSAYAARSQRISCEGYGIFARYHMFTVDGKGELQPVLHPDPIRFTDMVGYERERKAAEDNVRALLSGSLAANVLLSGDAGTGKSATVKAIANAYRKDGLRLIELNKNQLCFIPRIMDRLCRNPLKFIIFIDDLTFAEDDADFGTLKATLEGSISARMRNTVIYATSNRRHIVKESFSDGSDKHENDTVQERISLSERFGITITFQRPQKKLYLDIVHELARQVGLSMNEAELDLSAEQYALCKSGRSPRAARQLIDKLVAERTMDK